jgi:hypothetical protein
VGGTTALQHRDRGDPDAHASPRLVIDAGGVLVLDGEALAGEAFEEFGQCGRWGAGEVGPALLDDLVDVGVAEAGLLVGVEPVGEGGQRFGHGRSSSRGQGQWLSYSLSIKLDAAPRCNYLWHRLVGYEVQPSVG